MRLKRWYFWLLLLFGVFGRWVLFLCLFILILFFLNVVRKKKEWSDNSYKEQGGCRALLHIHCWGRHALSLKYGSFLLLVSGFSLISVDRTKIYGAAGPRSLIPSPGLFSLLTPIKMVLVFLWKIITHCPKQPFRFFKKLKTNTM